MFSPSAQLQSSWELFKTLPSRATTPHIFISSDDDNDTAAENIYQQRWVQTEDATRLILAQWAISVEAELPGFADFVADIEAPRGPIDAEVIHILVHPPAEDGLLPFGCINPRNPSVSYTPSE